MQLSRIRGYLAFVTDARLTAIYHMLRGSAVCNDLGADHFHRSPEVQTHRLVKQIGKPGFSCTIAPAEQTEAVSI